MPRIRIGNRRSILAATLWAATVVVGASIADAQGGPAWSATGSLGLAPPLGGWNTDLDPGTEYRLSVSRGVRLKPVAEVRLRVVALRERPLVSVPIAVGVRF